MELEISKMLTVSISHLTEKDCEILNKSGFPEDAYSYIIPTFYNTKYIKDDYEYFFQNSEQITKILDFARENNCQFVRFDQDGPVLENFPTFDW